MASQYDALLEVPKSEYDALLDRESAAVRERRPLSSELSQYIEGPGFEKPAEQPSPNRAGQILENAATGLARTAEGFVPHSLADVLGFLTPVVSSVHELKKGYQIGKEILTTPATIEEATRKFSPESFALADADKTPAFSKERFTAGFGTLSQMLMAAGIVRGLPRAAKPIIAEPVRPAIEPVQSILPKSPEAVPALTGEAIEQAPMSDVIAPEVASPPSASIPLTFDEYSAAKGVSSTPPSFPEYHRAAGGVSEPSAKAAAQRTADALTEWGAKRDELKAEYDSMLASGELREPTRIEKLQAAAKGEGSAAEAARRLLAKRATVPDLKSTEEAVAHGESGTADVPALNAKRDALLGQAETATGDEKVALITQAQLYREAAQTATKTPRLLPGEQQGDLISSTQPEDFALVGERGIDTKAADEAAAARAEEAKLKQEHEQGLLSDFQEHQARVGDELLDAIQSGGGLPAKSSPRSDVLSGELKNIREEVVSETGKQKYGFDYNKIFTKDAPALDTLTQHLRAKGFDVETPNDTLSLIQERLRSGKTVYGNEARGANDWTGATEPAIGGMKLGGGERGALNLAPLKDIQDSALLKRRMSPLDAATGERSARLQKSFADAERAQKEIKRVAPTERRQSAISVWMEAGGDAATLDQWAKAAKGDKFKRAAEDAKSLSTEEIAIAQKARAAFDILSRRGNTYDVLSNHRDHYVPHVWDVTKEFSGVGSSKLQDKFKFNKARTFQNFFEGDQAGFTPKTLAIGKLFPAYLHEMNKVIADRQFIQDIQDKTASDGTPLVIPRGQIKSIETNSGGKAYLADPAAFKSAKDKAGNPVDPANYKTVDQPALHDWRWESKDEAGNPIYMKDDLAVHPELAKRLNAMMGKSAIREWYNEPSSGVATIPKAIAKGLDTSQAVMKREMFGLLAPFHQVQEGTHGIGHLVNPFTNIPDMSRPTPEHIDAMKHGLMILPDRAASQNYLEGVGGKNSFITQLARKFAESKAGENVAGKVSAATADVIDGYQNYLFHQYIPGLKFKTYEHIQARNMARYSGDLTRGELTESDVKLLSAEQTNAAYGHLNYALLDRNPTMQHILQLGLLAPDFLEARARFSGQALKTLAGSKSGVEQFRAIATLAAIQAGIAYTTSKLMGDDWDWKHPFEVTHNGRTYALRSVPEDLHRLLFQGSDVRREFVSARINPLAQKADQLRTGLNYRGEKTGALDTFEELLANYIPITARSIPGMRNLTETSRNSPVSPLEQLAGSLGLRISRHSAITEVHQLASKWMDSQKMERDKGVYPISKFQQLRYALEDGDLDRGRAEWQKLLSKERDAAKLAKGFHESITHPFTKSKKMDIKFRAQLKDADRLTFDHAEQVRKGILHKFESISGRRFN